MFTYFVSLKPGHFRTYSTPHDSFWCHVGSGMENHTKYGNAIYFHDDELFVNLFSPSVLEWKKRKLVLEQRSRYPHEDRTELTVVSADDSPLTLRVRVPQWTANYATFSLNGAAMAIDGRAGRYATVERVWRKGDRLTVTIPMTVRADTLRGAPERIAFLYRPSRTSGIQRAKSNRKGTSIIAMPAARTRAEIATQVASRL